MAGIPDNIVAILGTDNAGNVVSIESSIFRAFETTTVQSVSAAPIAQTVEQPRKTLPVPVTIPDVEPLIFTADPNYIPQVNSTKDNLINSILYQRGLKMGLNTLSPQFTFDVYGGSINVSPLELKDGYRINRYLMAWQDITKYTLYLGDSTFLKIVDVNSLLISGLALVTSPTTPRVLSIDDTGLVSTLSLTSGSVIFSNGVGLVQDNAAFFWDATNKRLGIGNKVPTEALHVTGSIRQSAVTTAMLKADSTGKIVAGIDGTDYLSPTTLTDALVTGKLLTGLNATGSDIQPTDSILIAFGKLKNQINGLTGALVYQGVWDASLGTAPTATPVKGYYYKVSVAGATNLSGITDWKVGDWAIYNGTAWDKVDNTDSVSTVNGYNGAVSLVTGDVPEGAGSTSTKLYYTDTRARLAISSSATGLTYTSSTGAFTLTSGYSIPTTASQTTWDTAYTNRITSLTTTGNSGASSLISNVLNIPTYTLSGLGGQPSSANLTSLSGLTFASTSFVKMTAAGTFSLDTSIYYLANNPSGYTNNTGTVTNVSALTIGATGTDITSSVATSTTTPVITLNIPTASAANRGALSAADWTTFNSKQAALGYVPANSVTTITINGTTLSLAANRSWSVGTVTDVAALTIVSTGIDITSTVTTGTTTPVITLSIPTASASARGALSSTDWTTFNNKQAALSGTGFVKSTAGTIYYDTATYYLASNPNGYISGNQSITLSGDVSGTGTTAITTTLATITQAATGSFVKVTLDAKGRVIGNTAVTSADITGILTYTPVPTSRTITINGTTYDLSTNRSWTIDIGTNVRNVIRFTATAGQTTFTITGGYTVGLVDVYLNGARLIGSDYTASNGTTVVLAAGVIAGDVIETVSYTSYAASSISGAGTTGYLTKWTGSSSQGNSIIQDSGSAITVGGSVTATGGIVSSGGYVTGLNLRNAYQVLNLNTIKAPGLYNYDGGISGTQPLGSEWYNVRTIEVGDSARYSQFVMPYSADRIFYRRNSDAGWGSYMELIHSGNYNSYAPALTGGGASGTWGISISGNAATVTNGLYTNNYSGTLDGRYFFDYGFTTGYPGTDANTMPENRSAFTYANNAPLNGCIAYFGAAGYGIQLNGQYNGDAFSIRSRNGDAGSWRPWKRLLTDYNYNDYSPTLTGGGASGTWGINVTGNAATATTATTANNLTNFTNQSGNRYTTDFNSIVSTGFFNAEGLPTNAPGTSGYGQLISAKGIDTGLQIYGGHANDNLWFRGWSSSGGTFTAWRSVLHSGNYNSYSPTLTGGGASGTWGINVTGTSNNITAYTINQSVGTSNSPTFAGQTINGGGQLIRSSSSNTGGSRTINHCKVASTASPIYAIQVTGLTNKLINWVCYFGSNDAYLGYSAYQIIAAGMVWFNSSGVAFDQGSNWTYQAGSNNGTLQYTFNPSGYANSLVFGSGNVTGAGGLTTSYHIVFYGDGVNSMTINYL